MTINLYEMLLEYPELVFFLTLGIGYLLGHIKVFKFRVGATAGVLVAGLVFGHFGMPPPSPLVQSIGFILFIYCVGVEAGPNFLSVFLSGGLRYFALAVVIATAAFFVSWGMALAMGLSMGHAAGLMAGALTSTPTLAAAQDAVNSGLAGVPAAMREAVVTSIGVSYAITYIFGLIGLLLLVRVLPAYRRIDLKTEARKLAVEYGIVRSGDDGAQGRSASPLIRTYEVQEDAFAGDTLENVALRSKTGSVVHELKRGGRIEEASAETVLERGDRVSVIGPVESHRTLQPLLGPETLDSELLDVSLGTTEVVVSNADVVGKRLGEVVPAQYGVFINGVVRAGIPIPVNLDMVLARGDTIAFTGVANRLKKVASGLGEEEQNVEETDLLTFSLGIAAGLFLAEITVVVGALSVGLGMAGGLLLSGIVVGTIGSHKPSFGRIPPAARSLLKDLGLLFFMASVGLNAGGGIAEALVSVGPSVFLAGVAVTTLPMLIGFAVGTWLLRIHPALLMGALTGAMTSTPALNVLTKEADSSVPALGYAGTYTFANVFLALAGAMMMILR